jgi:predicted MPP superfamily phosphohydrolase
MADRFDPGAHLRFSPMTRRAFLIGGTAAAASVALYGGTRARHDLQITHRQIAIADLPDAFVGFSMVQLSDIHLVEYTEPWFLVDAVERINRINPDIVLLTGDFVSRGPLADSTAWRAAGVAAEILSTLKAPQRFGILGNHDVAVGSEHVIQPLEAHKTPMLVDSYVAIERGHDRIWLCGTDDASMRTPVLSLAVPQLPDVPVILMVHEPDYADTVRQHPRFPMIDVMLSGHTHGGQVRLPLAGPMVLPPMGRKYVEGAFQIGHMQLYVNRGLGTVGLPMRLNCPPEITHITLIRGSIGASSQVST